MVYPCSDGTPGGQMVSERFELDWPTALVSSFGVIVVRFDGRGSGFQGTNLLHRVQKKLGVFEERDQLEALRYPDTQTLREGGVRRDTASARRRGTPQHRHWEVAGAARPQARYSG